MRKLFEVGLNDGGFYVFPYTSPPQCQARGDEVDLAQATALCDSLNRNVATYISLLAISEPTELLSVLRQHRGWDTILSLIIDLIRTGKCTKLA